MTVGIWLTELRRNLEVKFPMSKSDDHGNQPQKQRISFERSKQEQSDKNKLLKVFDFHTHILPEIDDGSRNIRESLQMIDVLTRQGVSGIAATPHFYAWQSSPKNFFTNRQVAWEKLKPHLRPNTPEIRLGAEVQYFEGIQNYSGLEYFCLEGTRLLLIEMPECKWTERMVSAILDIHDRRSINVMLAHIERYLSYNNKMAFELLLKHGILMQANTGFFIDKQRKAMRLLRNNKIHLLGTDAHTMSYKKPNLAQALNIMIRKKGMPFIQKINERENTLLYNDYYA